MDLDAEPLAILQEQQGQQAAPSGDDNGLVLGRNQGYPISAESGFHTGPALERRENFFSSP